MATLRQRHQLRASRIQSNRILDLDWLFEQPGKFTAKPTCLATLGLSQDDVPMLLNLYEDQDAALPQAHLLQLLRHFKLSEEDLLRILARCTEVQSWAVFALLDLTMAHAKVAFTPAAAIVADEDEKPEVACEVMRLIAYMGNADDEVWEDAHSLLVAGLANCSDEARATAHVLALKRLYQVDDLEEDELAPEKQRPVREEAVVAVQEAYRRHLVDVEEAGGFTRFLEVCNWAINPDDAVVKDFRANISAELVEDEAAQNAHLDYIEQFREEWIAVHQQHRADRIGKLLNRALLLFAAFFFVQLGMLFLQHGIPSGSLSEYFKRVYEQTLD